jgi:hypothetical protein
MAYKRKSTRKRTLKNKRGRTLKSKRGRGRTLKRKSLKRRSRR